MISAAILAIDKALALLPPALDSRTARAMLLAIGLQESGLRERVQIVAGGGKGPARGLWQFERGGGVRGVLTHQQAAPLALRVCMARQVQPVTSVVWGELETDDVLAAALARLLLYSDPQQLPTNADAGWALYLRTWRPGKPKPETWPGFYAQALAAVTP
jgi:hypothetical protein